MRARKDTAAYRATRFIQRHKLGVGSATLLASALVIGTITTAWEARQARREKARTEQRFNQVRELAHSLPFDYHEAIAALPGSTATRQRLVKDGLKYLDNLSGDAGNDSSLLRELADAYEKVAAVQGGAATSKRGALLSSSNLGDTPGAIASMQKALQIRERLSVMEPNNLDIRDELAFCYLSLGGSYLLTGPPEKAIVYTRKAIPLLESSLVAKPSDEDLQYKLTIAYIGLAKASGIPGAANLGDTKAALNYMGKAQAVEERLATQFPGDPDYQLLLGTIYNSLGFLFAADGKQEDELREYLKAIEIDRALVRTDPENTVYRRELAVQLGNACTTLLRLKDKTGALEKAREALSIYESLAAADPNDVKIRRNLAVGYRNVGAALGVEGGAHALENFHQALQIFSELNRKDPNNADFRRQWAHCYLMQGHLQSDLDDLGSAIESDLKGVKIAEALVASAPTNASARNTLAQLYEELGNNRAKLAVNPGTSAGRQTELRVSAKEAYQKSLDLYQEMKNKGTLGAINADKPNELARAIGICDAAVK